MKFKFKPTKKIVCIVAGSTLAVAALVFFGLKFLKTEKSVIILSDRRCEECGPRVNQIIEKLKQEFPKASFKTVDYSDSSGRELYDEVKLQFLPAILFPGEFEKNPAFAKISQYTVVMGKYRHLRIGSSFDPKAEICNNGIDDDNNGQTDCEDSHCKKDWMCMEKTDRPVVDVFVMSHCPYGTQIEKGLIPVWKLLDDKADINLRFVNYVMHGEKEIKEQLRQYCIQKDFRTKIIPYMECFLKDGKDKECIEDVKINSGKLSTCVEKIDAKHRVTSDFKDKSTWMGRFPKFSIDQELNTKFSVRGSPTLVINNVVAEAGRNPAALLKAICYGFSSPPEECTKELSSDNPSPGFGFKTGEGGGQASCGG